MLSVRIPFTGQAQEEEPPVPPAGGKPPLSKGGGPPGGARWWRDSVSRELYKESPRPLRGHPPLARGALGAVCPHPVYRSGPGGGNPPSRPRAGRRGRPLSVSLCSTAPPKGELGVLSVRIPFTGQAQEEEPPVPPAGGKPPLSKGGGPPGGARWWRDSVSRELYKESPRPLRGHPPLARGALGAVCPHPVYRSGPGGGNPPSRPLAASLPLRGRWHGRSP